MLELSCRTLNTLVALLCGLHILALDPVCCMSASDCRLTMQVASLEQERGRLQAELNEQMAANAHTQVSSICYVCVH